eukprot:scaffold16960_cov167-Skeletonema_dohrnii-CCMP3373.AAC.1
MHATDWSNGNDWNLIDCNDMCDLIEKQDRDQMREYETFIDKVHNATAKELAGYKKINLLFGISFEVLVKTNLLFGTRFEVPVTNVRLPHLQCIPFGEGDTELVACSSVNDGNDLKDRNSVYYNNDGNLSMNINNRRGSLIGPRGPQRECWGD